MLETCRIWFEAVPVKIHFIPCQLSLQGLASAVKLHGIPLVALIQRQASPHVELYKSHSASNSYDGIFAVVGANNSISNSSLSMLLTRKDGII